MGAFPQSGVEWGILLGGFLLGGSNLRSDVDHSNLLYSLKQHSVNIEHHSVHWGINPPQKHHPLFLANPPPKSVNCPSPLLDNQQSPLYIGFS